ncbi:hypothetical protein EST38_g11854 [Candolleomyces aberdarensis]|uniref:Cytochrome P450 n=1 Tax=Candolleomyces aberdarensis TaxID=2316362 RepID=A0A4Q2D656_9AGAR|nr:hypothetical protein EST38_g11854 [Candolleomyces aberdarensis]
MRGERSKPGWVRIMRNPQVFTNITPPKVLTITVLQFDFLQWTMDSAIKHGESDRQIVLRMMLTNFGSIHTTSLTFTNALLTLLAHPQYIDPLRAEIERAIKEEGWTKAAMDKMELLESFMKESQRIDIIGAVLGFRTAIEDLTLNGVFIPKGTMLASNILDSHFSKSAWGSDPLEFDPYRCLKLQKESGKPIGITTTSPFVLIFGHGRHACPGRFFAAQEMKLMMAYMLVHYDVSYRREAKELVDRE